MTAVPTPEAPFDPTDNLCGYGDDFPRQSGDINDGFGDERPSDLHLAIEAARDARYKLLTVGTQMAEQYVAAEPGKGILPENTPEYKAAEQQLAEAQRRAGVLATYDLQD